METAFGGDYSILDPGSRSTALRVNLAGMTVCGRHDKSQLCLAKVLPVFWFFRV